MSNLRADTVSQGSVFGSQKGRKSVNRHLQTGNITVQVKNSAISGGEKSHRRPDFLSELFTLNYIPIGKIPKTET